MSLLFRPLYATSANEDRVKSDTGRRSALFERGDEGIILKGTFARLKISDELSNTLPFLSYLGITYRKMKPQMMCWIGLNLELLPFIAESLIDGITLVIDELDAKIHPALLRHIIMLYNDMEVSPADLYIS